MAFGNPFSLRQALLAASSAGWGSKPRPRRRRRRLPGLHANRRRDNPGNSGGPLINLRGEVVGLNTAIASNSGGNDGIGFSIPINIAMSVTRQLVEHGRVDRGFLGVMLDGNFNLETKRVLALQPHRLKTTSAIHRRQVNMPV
jgi:serine protease Do